jgi:hypothetical protein
LKDAGSSATNSWQVRFARLSNILNAGDLMIKPVASIVNKPDLRIRLRQIKDDLLRLTGLIRLDAESCHKIADEIKSIARYEVERSIGIDLVDFVLSLACEQLHRLIEDDDGSLGFFKQYNLWSTAITVLSAYGSSNAISAAEERFSNLSKSVEAWNGLIIRTDSSLGAADERLLSEKCDAVADLVCDLKAQYRASAPYKVV